MNGAIINKFKTFWVLVRAPNLVFLAWLQFLVFALYVNDLAQTNIQFHHFLMTCLLPTICIATFGNVWNDYRDLASDSSNRKRPFGKEQISKKHLKVVNKSAAGFAILSVILASIFSNSFLPPLIFISCALLLVIYSTKLKCLAFIGNLLVAFLSTLAVSLPMLLYHPMHNIVLTPTTNLIFLIYFLGFIFLFTLMREIIKDVQDEKGDRLNGCQTAVVQFGIKCIEKVIFALFVVIAIGMVVWLYFTNFELSVLIFVLAVIPFFVLIVLFMKYKNYAKLSSYLKAEMAIASLLLIFQKLI